MKKKEMNFMALCFHRSEIEESTRYHGKLMYLYVRVSDCIVMRKLWVFKSQLHSDGGGGGVSAIVGAVTL